MPDYLRKLYEQLDQEISINEVKLTLVLFLRDQDKISGRVHPLGFNLFNLGKLDDMINIRLHIWDKAAKIQNADLVIHNHPFELKSLVLVGAIQNKTYSITRLKNKKLGFLYSATYSKKGSLLTRALEGCSASLKESSNIKKGQYYSVKVGAFHESINIEPFSATLVVTKEVQGKIPLIYSKNDHNDEIEFTRNSINLEKSNKLLNKLLSTF